MKNTLSKIRNISINAGRRILTVLQFGAKTANEVSPFGIDSSPLNNYTALYLETDNISEPVIAGYINQQQLANQGELRLYSIDPETNVLRSYVWLDNNVRINTNGTIQLNGNASSTVKYPELDTSLTNVQTALNAELQKIQSAITSLGGTYVRLDVDIDISASENNDILTS